MFAYYLQRLIITPTKLLFCFLIYNVLLNFFVGKRKLTFVPRKFVSPPREFRFLYGPEIRQTVLDNFVVVAKEPTIQIIVKKKPKLVQRSISSFFPKRK